MKHRSITHLLWLSLIVGLCISCTNPILDHALKVERCADMPIALTAAAHFTIDGKGYIFGGRMQNGTYNDHLFCYDPQIDKWTDLGTTPLKARVRPRAIAVEENVYIGLGMKGQLLIDSTYLTDWWRWTPSTNQWKRLCDYPSLRTVGPVVTHREDNIYVAYGGKQNFERWIFQYSIAQDQWTKLSDGLERMAAYPPRAHSTVGAICNNRFFIGTGYFRGSQDFWVEVEISNDSIVWHRRSKAVGKRHNAVALNDDSYIYLAGGHYYGGTVTNGLLYNDVLRYNPQTDQWETLCHLPDGERENMSGWIINNTLYVGLGSDKYNRPCQQLYRISL